MANSASISASIAGRYAQALFDIVKESGRIDGLSDQIDSLSGALHESADLRAMIASPVLSREDQGSAIGALADKLGLDGALKNTLSLMAQNRRLFALPQFAEQIQGLIADERGEMTAEVTSAVALSKEQQTRLTATLSEKSGKKVKLNARVDEDLIGGMIVKLGSQMIDSSVKSKLATLTNAMKEVG